MFTKRSLCTLLLLALLCALSCTSRQVMAQTATTTVINVTATTNPTDLSRLSVGQSFQLSVALDGTGNGYGYTSTLQFDPEVLDVQLAPIEGMQQPGAAIPGPAFPIPVGGTNTIFARNAVQGNKVHVDFTYLNPAQPVNRMSGTLFAVTFTLKKSVASSVLVTDLRIIEKSAEGAAVDAHLNFASQSAFSVNGGVVTSAATCNLNNICDNALGENAQICPSDCSVTVQATESQPLTPLATLPVPPESASTGQFSGIVIGAIAILLVAGVAVGAVLGIFMRRR